MVVKTNRSLQLKGLSFSLSTCRFRVPPDPAIVESLQTVALEHIIKGLYRYYTFFL